MCAGSCIKLILVWLLKGQPPEEGDDQCSCNVKDFVPDSPKGMLLSRQADEDLDLLLGTKVPELLANNDLNNMRIKCHH